MGRAASKLHADARKAENSGRRGSSLRLPPDNRVIDRKTNRAERAEKPAKSAAADVTEGKCPECGKTKPVQNGVMASHQKGFGKACPGSRKPPA